MSAVQSNLQKLESLVKQATNARQRKMYQSLLDKARQDLHVQEPAAHSFQAESKAKADKVKLTATESTSQPQQSQPAEERVLPHLNASNTSDTLDTKERVIANDVAKADTNELRAKVDSAVLVDSTAPTPSENEPVVERPAIFQAIGLIRCVAQIEEERLTIVIDNQPYELRKGGRRLNKQFNLLKQDLEQNGSRELWLRVYPKVVYDSNSQTIRYWFALVKAYLDDERSRYPNLVDDFVFRGVWQRVPHCQSPVISIYRNLNNLNFYRRLSPTARKAFAQPHSFPVDWSAPVEPFRYHPKLDEERQMPRYFVQVRAVFKAERFEVVEILDEPTLEIPKHIQPK